ncbi:hypothetical protein HNP48_004276 [Acidovorax soli]|jgi:hypothetical protein|uniref:Uncharacterized protein n=1 Tax=Acidovorax soli TaxID=592050 RepID=A0A7X0PGL6_9BURK|nr:hypothetical protein [Acidovorax soli]MBB6561582.1 hypothetical protein [Acidovorax soli]
MKNCFRSRRRIEPLRTVALFGLMGCAVAFGLVELFALQRSRYQAWRGRHSHHSALPR